MSTHQGYGTGIGIISKHLSFELTECSARDGGASAGGGKGRF